MAIRHASQDAIAALVEIENASFPGNHLDRRRFRYLLANVQGALLVDAMGDALRAYVLLLFRANAMIARLYSIATHPAHLGGGIGVGAAQVEAAERQARQHGYTCLRLEIRTDHAASLALFRGRGYREFGRHVACYHDGMDALGLPKPLARILANSLTGSPCPAGSGYRMRP